MEYLSVTQFGEKYKMNVGRIRHLISQGRIPAIKIGNQWAIPAGTPPPEDRRVKSGMYRNWRQKQKKNGEQPE